MLYEVITANGSHSTHFNTTWGPAIASCTTCHTGTGIGDATHVNNQKSFVTAHDDTTETTLAATGYCNNCHGIASYDTETIKAEWPTETVA